LFKHMDNKFDKAKYKIEATSMTNRRTSTHVINDKNTDESTYVIINKEVTDNFENEDNLEEQLRFEKTYTTIYDETTNSSSNVNIKEKLFEPELAYITINNKATNNSRSKVNLKEQLLRSADQEHNYISVFDTDFSDKKFDNTFFTLTQDQTFITWNNTKNFLDSYGLKKSLVYKENKLKQIVTKIYIELARSIVMQRVNGNLSKNILMISFTTVVDEHNYLMTSLSQTNIAKYCKFANAISLEFSNSIYCLYIFYIDLNIKKNLWNKLGLIEFKKFYEAFFGYRNTLVPSIFKSYWKSLKEKYELASSYIKQQLDLFKHKWAMCYTNNQFTAGTNSIQRVESLNHKIHNCIKSNSSVLILVKEIQLLLNKESGYARVEEYKEQIPTTGLTTI
ncbi:28804_t:CDS:2, partial [Gigaspora margarita]